MLIDSVYGSVLFFELADTFTHEVDHLPGEGPPLVFRDIGHFPFEFVVDAESNVLFSLHRYPILSVCHDGSMIGDKTDRQCGLNLL